MRLPKINLLPKRQKEEPIVAEELGPRRWKLVIKTYSPPRRDVAGITFESEETQRRILQGVTTLVFEDELSGELMTREVIGSEHDDFEEVIDRVEKYGPQHIRSSNGAFYTVSKYVDPNQKLLDLPLQNVQPARPQPITIPPVSYGDPQPGYSIGDPGTGQQLHPRPTYWANQQPEFPQPAPSYQGRTVIPIAGKS